MTILPWTIRNAEVMHRFIPVSDETGITLVGTYNAASAANPGVPYKWRLFYGIPGERALIRAASHLTEPQIVRHAPAPGPALHLKTPAEPVYRRIRQHAQDVRDGGHVRLARLSAAISLPLGVARDGVIGFWIVCLLALAGAFSRPVRAAPKWVWAVPLLLALSVVLVNVETPRFRAPIDPFLLLVAAAGLTTQRPRSTRGYETVRQSGVRLGTR